jgi:hypothetical protein
MYNGWMDKENVVYIHNGVLLSHKEDWNYVIYRTMGGAKDQHVREINQSHKISIAFFLWHVE